jgi:FG-GAP repeat
LEVDQQTVEPIDVTVTIDDPIKGELDALGSFADLGNGHYGLTNVTAAAATASLRNLRFVPVENRITIPLVEPAIFTIEVTDNKSAPVTDTQTVVRVTGVNETPVIVGTRAGQIVIGTIGLRLFSSVTVTDVDDLTLQPLTVTIQLSNPTKGVLQNLGSFVFQGNGRYRATGLTPAQATQQLRALEFYGVDLVGLNERQLIVFTLTVEDGFASPVVDSQTSVMAYSPNEGRLQPTNSVLRATYGYSVDTFDNFAVAGSPGADVDGSNSGAAVIYRLVPGTTNTWQEWRQLLRDGLDVDDQFGTAVSISSNLCAVGAIKDEADGAPLGVVYIFSRDTGGTDNWGFSHRLKPTNIPVGSLFGFSVDLSGDLLAVGAPKATLSSSSPAEGAVFLFGRNVGGTNNWGEIMRWEPRAQTSLDCGWSVALEGDCLITGAPRNKTGTAASAPKGAVFCFNRDTGGVGAWGLSQTIRPAAVTNADLFGTSVSLKGTLLAVGAPNTVGAGGANEAGAAYLFAAPGGGTWAQTLRLDAGVGGEPRFGKSVALENDYLLIGAPGNTVSNGVGSAYLYRRTATDGTSWQMVERLRNPLPATSAHFGSAVGLCKDVGMVGAVDSILDTYTQNDTAFMYRFGFNNAPAVAMPLADQPAEWGVPFAYTVPSGVFVDPDLYDVLTVQTVLPTAGHGLVVTNMTVSGTPVVLGPVPVEVRATDASGAGAVAPFNVVVLVDGVQLANTPRNIWNVMHFGKDAVNPAQESTLWGGTANPDGDTSNNDVEYAFGGSPTTNDVSGQLTLTPAAGGNLLLTYVRRRNDPALNYTLQGTTTLSTPIWEDVLAYTVNEDITPLDAALERVEVTISTPLAGPSMFFRVRVW